MTSSFDDINDSKTLIFVYNARSKGIGRIIDSGHKIFRPSTYTCSLCEVTHGWFKARKEWNDFLGELDCGVEFFHRDDWEQTEFKDQNLPLVLLRQMGATEILLNAIDIEKLKNLNSLIDVIRHKLIERV